MPPGADVAFGFTQQLTSLLVSQHGRGNSRTDGHRTGKVGFHSSLLLPQTTIHGVGSKISLEANKIMSGTYWVLDK